MTVFSPATRSAAIKGAVAIVLDEHRDAIDLATRITSAVTETLAELDTPASRTVARLTTTEQTMLHYALELAQDQIYSKGDEFTHDDQTAIETLRRGAEGPDAPTDTTPIVLRWDRLVMHPTGEDDQTIVACMTDDGRPAALFLDDEYREALGLQLIDPDGDSESDTTPCSDDYPCEEGELCDRHEVEWAHSEGEHEYCGITCEVQLPSELLRNAILYRAIPGSAGMLDELLRRAAEGQDASPDACPLHSPDGNPCDCGHAAGADCHPQSEERLMTQARKGAYGICAECRQLYTPEPHNRTGFCSWACFDVKERPNAPEAFLAFLPAGARMERLDSEDNQ